jgi:hypothetical protein
MASSHGISRMNCPVLRQACRDWLKPPTALNLYAHPDNLLVPQPWLDGAHAFLDLSNFHTAAYKLHLITCRCMLECSGKSVRVLC